MAVETTLIVGVSVQIALTFVAIVAVYANRYKKVPPDAAMIVYGRHFGEQGLKVHTSGGKFILPIVESYRFLPLGVRTLDVIVNDIATDAAESRARLDLSAVAQVRVSRDPSVLQTAAGYLLRMTDRDIDELATKTLDAHVRAAGAGLTIAQINRDRDVFGSEVKRKAGEELKGMGLEVPSFVVKELEEHLDELIGSSGEVVKPVGPGSRGLIRVPWRWEMRYLAVAEAEIGVGEHVLVTGVRGQEVVVRRAST